jgi:cytidylate kinase
MKKIIIAIDGYSACGKSTTAKAVASELGYAYIDTGAMYRAITLYFMREHISLTNEKEIAKALENIQISFVRNRITNHNDTYMNGLNVEGEIRLMEVTKNVSVVSAIPAVRRFLVAQQKTMGKKGGIVMDGRDIGTVVFPDADLKIFMTAETGARAKRRQDELLAKGQLVGLDEIIHNLEERDRLDSSRTEGPLRQADDAVVVDTTYISIDEQVDEIVSMAVSKMSHIYALEHI